jgi:hypothetical protein
MLRTLLADLATQLIALAPAPSPTNEPAAPTGGVINSAGVVTWIATRIVPVILAALGVFFLFGAKRGEVGKVVTSSGIAVWGILFIAAAFTFYGFGDNILGLLFETE